MKKLYNLQSLFIWLEIVDTPDVTDFEEPTIFYQFGITGSFSSTANLFP